MDKWMVLSHIGNMYSLTGDGAPVNDLMVCYLYSKQSSQ